MSGIRVTYSGLISLVIGIGAIFLSLVFILIVTRTLEPIEFGTWGLITGLIVYATFIEPIVAYWASREIARGTESGRTIVASGSLLSIAGIAIYFIAAIIIGQQSDADNDALLFGIILIPVLFINRMLSAINTGWKPHAPLVAAFIFAAIEIVLALVFVYHLEMGVKGVVLTVTLAYNSSTISKTEEKTLSSGVQVVSIDFDNETIKRTHYNSNFTIDTVVVGNKIFDFDQNTSIYDYEDFANISYIKTIADGRIDSDSNNLSEFLEINFTVEVKEADAKPAEVVPG